MQFHDDHFSPDEKRATLRISISDMIALRLRAKEPGVQPPKLLYQSLPHEAISLLATIPRGTPAVSISQQSGRFPISKRFPQNEDGLVIVYGRNSGGRYEAVGILCLGKSYAMDEFCENALKKMDIRMNGAERSVGRHVYFAPTRDQWGAIMRDGGYAIIDPVVMHRDITPALLHSREDSASSGLIARIPVPPDHGDPNTSIRIVFSQVELTFDPAPDPSCAWIGYVECQRRRAIRSKPPESLIPLFRNWVQTLTAESGLASWIFRRGMFFGDHAEWWGEENPRRTLHEGIDFAEGCRADGTRHGIPEGTPVRALADGEIVAVLDDFLNKTIVVHHPDISDGSGDRFFGFYSHIDPAIPALSLPARGQVLGTVMKRSEAGAPAHLHVTGAWIPESIHPRQITLEHIHPAFMPVVLINFNSLLIGSRE